MRSLNSGLISSACSVSAFPAVMRPVDENGILKIVVAILIAVSVFFLPAPLAAQQRQDDGNALLEFVDAKLKPLVAKGQIPGAVVAIVQRGKAPILRGFGYADIASRRPMNPNTTRVRIGSMTKSFTGLAIMQLIDEGKLQLDVDANRFLTTEHIPERYSKPVTVMQLLTHRAGFDGDLTNTYVEQGRSPAVAKGWMSRQMLRVSPPGRLFAYDNVAFATLGQIIKDQDGRPYAASIKTRLFDRLGMTNATFGVDPRYPDNSTCYQRIRNNLVPCRHQILKDAVGAAGDMSLTAADAARYLQAILNGPTGGALIKPETFAAFTNVTHRIAPGVPGDGLGVYEMGPAGSGVFGHAGGIRGGSTLSMIIPVKGIALFVNINSSGGPDDNYNLSGLLDVVFSSYGSDDNFDAGELTSAILPVQLGTMFGNPYSVQASNSVCNEAIIPGQYMEIRPMQLAALAPRLLGRLALPEIEVAKQNNGNWLINGKPYRHSAACQFKSIGKSYVDGDISSRVSFAALPDGGVVGGPHTLAGWTKLKWYERANVVAMPYLAALFILPFALLAAWRAEPATQRTLRMMGFSGTILLVCILLEMEYASSIVQNDGKLFPVILWRIGWHFALVGIVIGIFRSIQATMSPQERHWRKLIIALMGVAGLIIVILSGYWGLIGTFTGNNFA
jgi:CubicO group peptidase (beta-lactamase class C family)